MKDAEALRKEEEETAAKRATGKRFKESGGKCIVICAGEFSPVSVSAGKGDYVIAVDGGYRYAKMMGLIPDLIIGDFDSCSEEDYSEIMELHEKDGERVAVLNKMKDDTDTFAALRRGLDKGCRTFYLYHAGGGRLEHTLANIQSLVYLKTQGAQGFLWDSHSRIQIIQNEKAAFSSQYTGYFSLFPLSEKAEGVTIQGMKYELHDALLTNAYPVGVSNEFIGKEAVVSVKNGTLAAIWNWG